MYYTLIKVKRVTVVLAYSLVSSVMIPITNFASKYVDNKKLLTGLYNLNAVIIKRFRSAIDLLEEVA